MTATMLPKEEKQPSPPGSNTSAESPPGSTSSAEMALENLTAAPALPPGVYFSPTKPESVLTYLDRWITGHAMPDAVGWIVQDDVYGTHPDVLASRYHPACTRNSEPSWWFLCHCKLQDTRGRGRTGAASRGDRQVAGEGNWKLEQTRQEVKCPVTGRTLGFMRNFGFYVHAGKDKRAKTRWLMEEYTSVLCPEDGVAREDGKKVLPALHRLYITPRDPGKRENNKRKMRCWDDAAGENDDDNCAPVRPGPGRVRVPAAYFDAIAALLPPSRLRRVRQEQTKDAQEAPPPPQPLAVVYDSYQGYEVSDEDDHAKNIHEKEMHAILEERQGNADDRESQQRDLLPGWQTGRDDVFADSSWIDEHYMKPE